MSEGKETGRQTVRRSMLARDAGSRLYDRSIRSPFTVSFGGCLPADHGRAPPRQGSKTWDRPEAGVRWCIV